MDNFLAGLVVFVGICFTIVCLLAGRSGGGTFGVWMVGILAIFICGPIVIVILKMFTVELVIAAVLALGFLIVYLNDRHREKMRGIETVEASDSPEAKLLDVLSKVKKGQVIPFGSYEWRVLEVEDGRALLLTEKLAMKKPFNEDSQARGSTWEKCTLRRYLNDTFYTSAFRPAEQALILESTVENFHRPYIQTLPDTQDKIFVPSKEEIEQYMPDPATRVLEVEGETVFWWLRDTAVGSGSDAFCVKWKGEVDRTFSGMSDYGVRPAIWVRTR